MKNIDFILESDEALKPSERLVLLLLESIECYIRTIYWHYLIYHIKH